MSDPVHNPPHYKSGGIEVIDVIEAFELGYRLGNVIKYVLRAGRKGDALEDLQKAAWYLDRQIDKMKSWTNEVKIEKRGALDVDVTSMDDVVRRMAKVFFDTPIPTTKDVVVPEVASDNQEYDG
jgi:hypothetical protein